MFRGHWLGSKYLKSIIEILRHAARCQEFSYFCPFNFQVHLFELLLIIATAPGVIVMSNS